MLDIDDCLAQVNLGQPKGAQRSKVSDKRKISQPFKFVYQDNSDDISQENAVQRQLLQRQGHSQHIAKRQRQYFEQKFSDSAFILLSDLRAKSNRIQMKQNDQKLQQRLIKQRFQNRLKERQQAKNSRSAKPTSTSQQNKIIDICEPLEKNFQKQSQAVSTSNESCDNQIMIDSIPAVEQSQHRTRKTEDIQVNTKYVVSKPLNSPSTDKIQNLDDQVHQFHTMHQEPQATTLSYRQWSILSKNDCEKQQMFKISKSKQCNRFVAKVPQDADERKVLMQTKAKLQPQGSQKLNVKDFDQPTSAPCQHISDNVAPQVQLNIPTENKYYQDTLKLQRDINVEKPGHPLEDNKTVDVQVTSSKDSQEQQQPINGQLAQAKFLVPRNVNAYQNKQKDSVAQQAKTAFELPRFHNHDSLLNIEREHDLLALTSIIHTNACGQLSIDQVKALVLHLYSSLRDCFLDLSRIGSVLSTSFSSRVPSTTQQSNQSVNYAHLNGLPKLSGQQPNDSQIQILVDKHGYTMGQIFHTAFAIGLYSPFQSSHQQPLNASHQEQNAPLNSSFVAHTQSVGTKLKMYSDVNSTSGLQPRQGEQTLNIVAHQVAISLTLYILLRPDTWNQDYRSSQNIDHFQSIQSNIDQDISVFSYFLFIAMMLMSEPTSTQPISMAVCKILRDTLWPIIIMYSGGIQSVQHGGKGELEAMLDQRTCASNLSVALYNMYMSVAHQLPPEAINCNEINQIDHLGTDKLFSIVQTIYLQRGPYCARLSDSIRDRLSGNERGLLQKILFYVQKVG